MKITLDLEKLAKLSPEAEAIAGRLYALADAVGKLAAARELFSTTAELLRSAADQCGDQAEKS